MTTNPKIDALLNEYQQKLQEMAEEVAAEAAAAVTEPVVTPETDCDPETEKLYERIQLRFIIILTASTFLFIAASVTLWKGFLLIALISALLNIFIGVLYATDKFYLPGYSLLQRIRKNDELLGRVFGSIIIGIAVIIASAILTIPPGAGTSWDTALSGEQTTTSDSTGHSNNGDDTKQQDTDRSVQRSNGVDSGTSGGQGQRTAEGKQQMRLD